MSRRIIAIILLLGLGLALWSFFSSLQAASLPGNDRGFEPAQPIAFSHRLHVGELGMDCLYCHSGAERSRHAGIPDGQTCMNCHSVVNATWGAVRGEADLAKEENRAPVRIVSAELRKLYDAMGLDEQLEPDPHSVQRPIQWNLVHSLPDHAVFDQSRHVIAGVDCRSCHGPVETMERVRQVENMSMGWCVNCHRDANAGGVNGKPVFASTDCAACHY
jgi:predicted CXXCH cytochrome family protein